MILRRNPPKLRKNFNKLVKEAVISELHEEMSCSKDEKANKRQNLISPFKKVVEMNRQMFSISS